jgi:hypothetical protein
MNLLVLILKRIELQDDILKALAEAGIKGGTVIDGEGMAKAIADLEDVPISGILRHVFSENKGIVSKVMLFVLENGQLSLARKTIKDIAGDLTSPNTGIMFNIPIFEVEGYKK